MNDNGSAPPPDKSAKRELKRKNSADFWKAFSYLLPYRRYMIVSIVSALFVGGAMAGGFTAMLPILHVLINGDTVPNWANRALVQKRLGVEFAADARALVVVYEKDNSPAGAAGISRFETITRVGDASTEAAMLWKLSDPAVHQVAVTLSSGRTVTIASLPPDPFYYTAFRPLLTRFPTTPVEGVAMVLLIGVCISGFGQTMRYFQEYYSDKAGIMGINDVRRRLYDHVLHIPIEFFGTKGTSDVTSRLVQDCQGLQTGFTTMLGQSIQMPINALAAFITALVMSWKLTLFIVLFAPVMVGIIQKFGRKMRRTSKKALQTSASMLGQIEGTLAGVRVVKGSNAERFERRRYRGIMGKLVDKQLMMSRIDAISSPVVEFLTLLVVCIVVIYATHLVQVTKELSAERFFTVMACLATIAESLRRFGKINSVLMRSGAAASRIFEVLNIPVERPRAAATRSDRPRIVLQPVAREVRFENVSFSYTNTTTPALSNVNLSVRKGESVAIVGRNGSGKTTLAALLPRFYDPASGRVTIDGIDIRDVTLKSLRNQISIVTQDSVIFPGTIAENIAYGHPLAARLNTDAESSRKLRSDIESAARQAFAHDFILEKPDGYDTQLGGLGGALSGGQKQRLNIARAIFRATPILIMDEATSQVDAESEHLIQQAIEQLMHERTMFIIAHRLNTIQSADRIVVMDRGQIVAAGQHDELLNSSEAYNNLYERQLFRRSDEPVLAGD